MTCVVCRPGRKQLRSNVEVAGTWDFKWPLGTRIRVAFQKPRAPQTANDPVVTDEDFRTAKRLVTQLARRWEEGVTRYLEEHRIGISVRQFFEEGIHLVFRDEWELEPPPGTQDVVGSEQRSPFLPGDPSFRDYDVLVSLERLPLDRVDPFRRQVARTTDDIKRPSAHTERLWLPASELGSYARRVDYGIPTVFIGPFGKAKDLSLLDYLKTPLAEYAIVHELGHVLGLAHEHQNPYYADTDYLDIDEIRTQIQATFDIKEHLSDELIRGHILDRWPGSLTFSDWQPPRRRLSEIDSVMAYPFHERLLKSSCANEAHRRFQDAMQPVARGTSPEAIESLPLHPTRTDLYNLVCMYLPASCRQPTDALPPPPPSDPIPNS